MQIATASIDDLDGIVQEAQKWFDEMDFGLYGNGYDLEVVIPWLTYVITSPLHEVLLAKEDKVIGIFIVFYKDHHSWHKGPIQACEQAWHTNPSMPPVKRGRVQIGLFEEMAKKVKARIKEDEWFYIGVDPRPEFSSVGKYLMRRGAIDTSHVLGIKGGDL